MNRMPMYSLKNAYIAPPALVLFYNRGHTTFDTNACSDQIGGVIWPKKSGGTVKSVGRSSSFFNDA